MIAIDGKTVRRSYQKKGAEEPIHVVSAFAARQRMVLGRTRVATNPMRSSPSPPCSSFDHRGRGGDHRREEWQREIDQKIIDKKADYPSSR